METENIQRSEHEEFAQRIKEENDRQNHRLAVLEENTRRLEKLNVSIERLAVNMENMLKEQLLHGSLANALINKGIFHVHNIFSLFVKNSGFYRCRHIRYVTEDAAHIMPRCSRKRKRR